VTLNVHEKGGFFIFPEQSNLVSSRVEPGDYPKENQQMNENSKRTILLTRLRLIVVLLSAFVFFWLMASLDVYEWFYEVSRPYESFQYDDLVISLFFFLIIWMLWLAFHLYKKATKTLSRNEVKNLSPRIDQSGLPESITNMVSQSPDSNKSPWLLLLSLIAVIIAAESLDMIFLHTLTLPSPYLETLVDVTVLVLMISPALYFIFLRPLLRQIANRLETEEALKQLNLKLEKRVEQRTAQLQKELAERKQTEAKLVEHRSQLRALSAQLSVAEEKERNRISTELHDNIGHALAIVNNRLGLLKTFLSAEREQKILDDINALITEAIRFTRSLSSELGSPMMNYLPFVSTLEWMAEDIIERNNLAFKLNVSGSPELPPSDSRIIFVKAIREILVNVVKHAKADNVEISLYTDAGNIVVEINDDGIGFDPNAYAPISPGDLRGVGIFTIRERMINLNGRFLIKSAPGRGTTVTLIMPNTTKQD
jgi:signal transduction histidine kinase